MEQPSPAAESEELTDSEESVYSGLEDSGSDSTSAAEEEEEDEDEGPEEGPGGSSPPRIHAKGASRKSKLLVDDSPLKENGNLLAQNEYEEDSSDEE